MNIIIASLLEALHMCIRTVPVLAASILAVDVLTAFGIINRFSFIIAPIARMARLSRESTLALVTSIGSTMSADSMTASLYRKGNIRGREALLSSQANSIAAYLRETFTYFVPVVIPLLGIGPGIIYVSAFILNVLFKLVFVLGAGRWLAPKSLINEPMADEKTSLRQHILPSQKCLTGILRQSMRTMLHITAVLFVASLLITLLDKTGNLRFVSIFVNPVMTMLQIPEDLFVPVFGYIASPSAGAAAIGTMYKAGSVSLYCTAAAALVGGMLSIIISTIRYTIPRNIALFGPKIGGVNAAVGFGMAVLSRVVMLVAIAVFFLQ